MADALERVTSLTSLNGCGQYGAIRAGGLRELKLNKEWGLGVWAALFLERSGATLTVLDLRWRDGIGSGGLTQFNVEQVGVRFSGFVGNVRISAVQVEEAKT